jgi:hypothetical protein
LFLPSWGLPNSIEQVRSFLQGLSLKTGFSWEKGDRKKKSAGLDKNHGAEDNLFQRSNPLLSKHRRPGPNQPNYGIPAELWSTVVQRVLEQKEPLRSVAAAYGVSQEMIRRIMLHVHKQGGQLEV